MLVFVERDFEACGVVVQVGGSARSRETLRETLLD
jgi:hypothetical protein